jgi:hypothetical protein
MIRPTLANKSYSEEIGSHNTKLNFTPISVLGWLPGARFGGLFCRSNRNFTPYRRSARTGNLELLIKKGSASFTLNRLNALTYHERQSYGFRRQ